MRKQKYLLFMYFEFCFSSCLISRDPYDCFLERLSTEAGIYSFCGHQLLSTCVSCSYFPAHFGLIVCCLN